MRSISVSVVRQPVNSGEVIRLYGPTHDLTAIDASVPVASTPPARQPLQPKHQMHGYQMVAHQQVERYAGHQMGPYQSGPYQIEPARIVFAAGPYEYGVIPFRHLVADEFGNESTPTDLGVFVNSGPFPITRARVIENEAGTAPVLIVE